MSKTIKKSPRLAKKITKRILLAISAADNEVLKDKNGQNKKADD